MKKLMLSLSIIAALSHAAYAQTPTIEKVQPAGNATPKSKGDLKTNTPKVEAPKVEAPKTEAPKIEAPKARTTKMETPASPMGDLKSMGSNILSELGTKLILSKIQSPKVLGLITTFLSAKSAIMPLLQSNPSGYASKFGAAQGDLTSGLKGVLSAQQMTNFMGLKPKTNDATNVLSNLFF